MSVIHEREECMPTLYVVATPIGNFGDFSPRAQEVLSSVGLIAAEDTRVTKGLLTHFGIHTACVSNHKFNEEDRADPIIERMLTENIDVALVTDAGTPAISDPGSVLVDKALQAGIEVLAVPGPTAMASALSVSGFDTREFAFYGFLPRKRGDLSKKLHEMALGPKIAVVHESPHRVIELMEVIASEFPLSRVSASCDLTKFYEKTIRGYAPEVLSMLESNEKTEKGEYCLVLDFHEVKTEEAETSLGLSCEGMLLEMMVNGKSMEEALDQLKASGKKRNELYAAKEKVKNFLSEMAGWGE